MTDESSESLSDDWKILLDKDKFDLLTWVPTIQANLSFDILDCAHFDGKTDKYLVNFKKEKSKLGSTNASFSRHIVASTLTADFDRKQNPNIFSGVFRYILSGTVNDDDDCTSFSDSLGLRLNSPLLRESFIGELQIIHNETRYFPKEEELFLGLLHNVSGLNAYYKKSRDNYAAPIRPSKYQTGVLSLSEIHKKLYNEYLSLVKSVSNLSNLSRDSFIAFNPNSPIDFDKRQYRVWKFKVFLSRDGLLMLKNVTSPCFSGDIDNCYLSSESMPRIFKMAAARIKHIFHLHYNHLQESDTGIKLSNLHYSVSPSKIVDAQTNRLLYEILDAKRSKRYAFTSFKGICNYTKSLLYVFMKHKFITNIEYSNRISVLENINSESSDIEDRNERLNFFIQPGNLAAKAIFIVAIITFATVMYSMICVDFDSFQLRIIVLIVSFIMGSFFHDICVSHTTKSVYIPSFRHSKSRKGTKKLNKKSWLSVLTVFSNRASSYSDDFVKYLKTEYKGLEKRVYTLKYTPNDVNSISEEVRKRERTKIERMLFLIAIVIMAFTIMIASLMKSIDFLMEY